MTVKTKGIVLGQIPLRDPDRKLILLTPDLGLIEVIARGVGGKKSKLSASAEVLAYSEFCLFEGKGGYIVDSADLDRNFYDLRLDLLKLSEASYFCELTRFILPDKDNAPDVLKLLLNTLWLLEKEKRSPAFLKAVYELRLLTLSGFAPDLSGCTSCGDIAVNIHLRIEIPLPVRQAMRYICEAPEEKLFSFRLTPDSEAALGHVTEAYVLCQTGGRFKTLDFLKSIL